VPFVLLFVDFCLNDCIYEIKLLWFELVIISIYTLINLISTKVNDYPVYPGMTWDSTKSILLSLSSIPVTIIYAIILYYLSKLKHKLFGDNLSRVETRKELLQSIN